VIHRNGKHTNERRKHRRFTVVHDLVEPIVLRYADRRGGKGADIPKHLRTQPAILTNLSAGGMRLITFLAPPQAKIFKMTLTIPGLDHLPIEGKVVHVTKRGDIFLVGIQFVKIAKKYQGQINGMAEDDADCQTRISLGLPDACEPECTFHLLCSKPQKAKRWRKA
jgi:hypothetical protein